MSTARVVVGLGNSFRSDDGVGLVVADAVRDRVEGDVAVVECEREPSRILESWEGAQAALVVDAVDSGATPGTLHRFDASRAPLPAAVLRSSTHAFGLPDAIELARALGSLPETVIVHGVEGGEFSAGDGLSAPVAAAVPAAVRAILDDLEQLSKEGRRCTNRQ